MTSATTAGNQASQPDQDRHFAGLKWRFVGPMRGGRCVAVAGHPTELGTYFMGTTGGGVWKTTSAGRYWENISDGYFKRASVGALTLAPSDPNVIYVGMGEATIRSNVSHGDGVYKSTDGGQSWRHIGLAETRNIGEIVVHPQNPDVVYVAALGHAFGPNEERGVFRSRDGGQRWENVLYRSPDAGAVDLAIDPTNPRILYAAFWEARRYPYKLDSGGPGSGLFRSLDGGDSWEEITRNEGLPQGVIGKIGLDASAARPGRVYALIEAEDGAMFRSDDWGKTWQRGSESRELRQRAWYYTHVYADPQDADTVWVLNVEAWKSVDGGKNFENVPVPHGDNHDLWIDPNDPLRIIEGNDGGAIVSFDGGASWSDLYNQPTAEMYHVSTDTQEPYRLYGAQQDNTTISVPSRSLFEAITVGEQFAVGGGESGYIQADPRDPNIVYAGSYGGFLTRYDHRTKEMRNIMVWPENPLGHGAESIKYRFQWTYPIVISPHDPDKIYVTSQHVHVSTDGGRSWEIISPDLSRAVPETLKPSGGPITKDNTGAEYYATIFAFAESPVQAGVFWAGSDDGLIHVSKDGGQSWQNVTPPDLPEFTRVSIIDASRHDPAEAYVAANRYQLDDFAPYLYKTSDYGQTWTKIIEGIPGDEPTRVIREDPHRHGLLYAGTEAGLYVSFNDGAQWRPFRQNLPVVPIHDLEVKGTDLVAATHGRGFWILDDLTPLYHEEVSSAESAPTLYPPRPTVQFKTNFGFGSSPGPGNRYQMTGATLYTYRQTKNEVGQEERVNLDAGQNPPEGVIIRYRFDREPDGDVTLTISDSEGNEIRSFSSKQAEAAGEVKPMVAGESFEQMMEQAGEKEPEDEREPRVPKFAGLNRFIWDMRYPGAKPVPGDKSMQFVGGSVGPLAPPGKYGVTLTVGDVSRTQPFELVADPRLAVSRDDLQAQFQFLLQVRDKLSQTHESINRIRKVREQVQSWGKRFAGTEWSEVTDSARALSKRLSEIEGQLVQVNAKSRQDTLNYPIMLNAKLAGLMRSAGSAWMRPTKQSHEVLEELTQRIDQQTAQLDELLRSELPKFNQLVQQANRPAVEIPED